MRANILGPLFAWLAVVVVACLYFNQRGRWTSLSGPEGYRDCFGGPPPAGLRLIRGESFRHTRYTGQLLAMECYVRAEGEFDTSGVAWKQARTLAEAGGLPALLRDRGLAHAPDWFRMPSEAAPAKVMASEGGRLFSIYPAGEGGLLIGGGWKTRER